MLAILTMVIGVPTSIFAGVSSRNSEHGAYQQAMCIQNLIWSKQQPVMGAYSKDQINLSDSGCPGPLYQEYPSRMQRLAAGPAPGFSDGFIDPFGTGILITGSLAVLFYLTLWTLGWVRRVYPRLAAVAREA